MTKRLLKSELVRRGITHEDLVLLLDKIGVKETKSSIDSKISRGSFSAVFFIQCLNAIGCKSFMPDISSDYSTAYRASQKAKNNNRKINS